MGRGAWLVVVALSGCDYFWHIDHVDLDGDAAAGDAGDGSICSQRLIDESFTTTARCQPWGEVYENNSTVMQGGGSLVITPTSSAQLENTGGCYGPLSAPFTDGGIIVRIPSALTGSEAFTGIQALGGPDATIMISGGEIQFQNFDASVKWQHTTWLGPGKMDWVRLRPDRTAGTIIAEYSGDRTTWTLLGAQQLPIPQNVQPVIVAGVNPQKQFSGRAVVTRFIICSN